MSLIIPHVRTDGREYSDIRDVHFEVGYINNADGSCLISCGNTHVICTATIEDRVPHFIRGTGSGWVTAEYGMIPRSTQQRMQREAARDGQKGRTHEIQRLIARSLRAVVDLRALGERQLIVDCDVIKADGGTRVASINGGYIAMYSALYSMHKKKMIKKFPITKGISAISCAIIRGATIVDPDFIEDSSADVDANFVIDSDEKFIEIQSTAERMSFDQEQLNSMLELAKKGCKEISQKQDQAIKTLQL